MILMSTHNMYFHGEVKKKKQRFMITLLGTFYTLPHYSGRILCYSWILFRLCVYNVFSIGNEWLGIVNGQICSFLK